MTSRSRSGSESTADVHLERLHLGDGHRLGERPVVGHVRRLADDERHARSGGVDRRVPGDREEPRRGGAALAPVAAGRPPHRRERLLRDVVGRVWSRSTRWTSE